MTVDVMDCHPLNELYGDRQLSEMSEAEKHATECGITYRKTRVRKNLIRAFNPQFSVTTTAINPKGDLNTPLKIDRINVEHCTFNTDQAVMTAAETCAEMEESL